MIEEKIGYIMLYEFMGDDVEGACGQLRNRELREVRENQATGYKTHQPKKKETNERKNNEQFLIKRLYIIN